MDGWKGTTGRIGFTTPCLLLYLERAACSNGVLLVKSPYAVALTRRDFFEELNAAIGTLLSEDDADVEAPHCCMLELGSDQEVTMKIDSTTFGAITIDGTTYQHDVVVRLSGEVVKRKKQLSKKLYGTSHVLSKDEAKFLFEKGCDQVVIGSGQMGNVHLSPEAEAYFERKGCEVLLRPTPEAIRMFNRSHARRIGLFHVTC
jgi:hypothetical protein